MSPSAAVEIANSASGASPAACAAYGSVVVVGVVIIVVDSGGNSISKLIKAKSNSTIALRWNNWAEYVLSLGGCERGRD